MSLQKGNEITCELLSSSNTGHLQQVYTGFHLLHGGHVIKLSQRICKKELIDTTKPPHLRDAKRYHLKVLVNRDRVIYYDCHDSFEIDGDALSKVDFYFKRSYSPKEIDKLNDKQKIFPLGLNCEPYVRGFDIFLLNRTILSTGTAKLRNLVVAMELDRVFGGSIISVDRADTLGVYPDFNLPPRILFMVRAFGPEFARSKQKHEENESINNTRAECIRLLKKEFGKHFLGGFIHEDYAATKFKDCLAPNNNLSRRGSYVQLMKEFPICVATTGLHGSIGWKMAEYVSYAKAIVTEKLNYRLPGHFENGENYLDFVSAEGCVEASVRLVSDPRLRSSLMMNNYRYYHSYLRPDSLVLNTLATAMFSQPVKAS
jgi:hypothetical protein